MQPLSDYFLLSLHNVIMGHAFISFYLNAFDISNDLLSAFNHQLSTKKIMGVVWMAKRTYNRTLCKNWSIGRRKWLSKKRVWGCGGGGCRWGSRVLGFIVFTTCLGNPAFWVPFISFFCVFAFSFAAKRRKSLFPTKNRFNLN